MAASAAAAAACLVVVVVIPVGRDSDSGRDGGAGRGRARYNNDKVSGKMHFYSGHLQLHKMALNVDGQLTCSDMSQQGRSKTFP